MFALEIVEKMNNFFERVKQLCLILLACLMIRCGVSDASSSNTFQGIDGRWSFSLTTFDTTGKLRQVGYATLASSMGPAIVAIRFTPSDSVDTRESKVVFFSRQAPPTALINDDGTSRFVQIHKEIVVAHTGIGADGRKIIADALRAAVEYEYTFDEDIPLERFLEELSMIFQQYTMKPGVRPFGCSILVTYIPRSTSRNLSGISDMRPQFYRIDPSGLVQFVADDAVVMGSQTEGVKELLTKGFMNEHINNTEDAVTVISKSLITAANLASKVLKWNENNCRLLMATFSVSNGLEVTPVKYNSGT